MGTKTLEIRIVGDTTGINHASNAAANAISRVEREAARAAAQQAREAAKLAATQEREAKKAADAQIREAQRATTAQEREQKKAADSAEREAKRTADAQAREDKRSLDARFVSLGSLQMAGVKYADKAHATATKLTDAQIRESRRAEAAQLESFKTMGQESAMAGFKMQAAFSLASNALQSLVGFGRDFVQAMRDGHEKARAMTSVFGSDRDKLRELATVMGESPDNKFTLDNARYNVNTGFRFDEGLAFRSQFHNSGEQFKGRLMSDKAFGNYETSAGQLAAARGFDPSDTGELAGSLTGFRDRSKMGDSEAEGDALGKLNSGMMILGRGKGRNNVLLRQFSMASAAALNEDSQKGTFQDSDEVAAAISVMAEKHDAQAAEMVRASNRGLRAFDDKGAGPLLKRAGIGPKTSYVDALKRLAPIINEEAKAKGINVDDALKPYFEDQLTREALGVGINRGVDGGLFDDRAAFGKTQTGPAIARATIASHQGSETGQLRQAEASIELSKAQRGSEESKVEILRKQATSELISEGKIDSQKAEIGKFLSGALTLGMLPLDDQRQINRRVGSVLNRRTPEGMQQLDGGSWLLDPEKSADVYGARIDQIQQAGGNPMEYSKEVAEHLRELLEIEREKRRRAVTMPEAPAALPDRKPAADLKRGG